MYIQTMIQRVKDKTQNAVHTYSRKIPLTNIKKYLCYMCVCTFHVIANFYRGTFGRHSSTYIHTGVQL